MPVVILYGPPAAGKDTITTALTRLDNNYQLYQLLKVGSGRTASYRMTTLSHVNTLRGTGSIIWETRRYGALYIIDRASLADMLKSCTPVLHIGQVEAVKAVTAALPLAEQLTTVWLWCPRDIAAMRITQRGTGDTAARLQAWDETAPLPEADIAINTAKTHPTDAAATINSHIYHPVQREPVERPNASGSRTN